jgi:hypothetical protein
MNIDGWTPFLLAETGKGVPLTGFSIKMNEESCKTQIIDQ